LHDGVSITPRPRPINRSPGTNATTVDVATTRPIRSTIPAPLTTKPPTINVFCVRRLANRSAPRDETSRPRVAAVKIAPVSMAL
jgi:hypothetical protein